MQDESYSTGNLIRLTMAQALVRYLSAQFTLTPNGDLVPLFGGIFAIFGHGNVTGLGEALYACRDQLPTYRGHNEQSMAHVAIGYAKAHLRRRMMAVTSSIGPGATNLVTAAAVAHISRLPLLMLPGDVFVSRAPDPVLQQLEDFTDGTVSVNDCLRPVSRYFDRIVDPRQLFTALPRALHVLTDPVLCGPVTLALPQDVQTQAYDWPESFFAPQLYRFRRIAPHDEEVALVAEALRQAERPVLIGGGGVLYAHAAATLRAFVETHGVPVAESQAGKGALPWDHASQLGPAGVSGASAANALLADADLVLAVGTRLQDFTTGSHALFTNAHIITLNVNSYDTVKRGGLSIVADAELGLRTLSAMLGEWRTAPAWQRRAKHAGVAWRETVLAATGQRTLPAGVLPYEGDVIGAVQRSHEDSPRHDTVVCAAGTLPSELEKLWRAAAPGGYHVEYGYSCMGYEIAGGLGTKMAQPDREVIVILGDGSYLMLNTAIATSLTLDLKLIVVVLDNRGYGCIDRLQRACGGAPFNNMWGDCLHGPGGPPDINFAAHARAMGANAEHVADLAALEQALVRARHSKRTYLICIETDSDRTTTQGGSWWDVAVSEVSDQKSVRQARHRYDTAKQRQRPVQTPKLRGDSNHGAS